MGQDMSPDKYDAFISYSHSADDEFAPILQQALHRFAKPWYKLRALHVFLDKAALPNTGALPTSLNRALESSRYLIVLASPESAASKWCATEIAYWREHKPSDTILIALTSGEIVWDDEKGDFDWSASDAVSPALQGAFAEEPKFTDFRWAKADNELSLGHARFKSAVADIAAPIDGRPKDELLGEDVRQHRRTMGITRTAVAVLVTLLTVAIGSAIVAYVQRDTARSRQLAAQSVAERDRRFDLSPCCWRWRR